MPTTETTQQSTMTMVEGRMGQNPQQCGKTTTAAATMATDSQAGGKDLMSLLEKEAIEQN
jgi:hypothetical protein